MQLIGPGTWRVAAGEVAGHAVAGDLDPDLDAERAVAEAVGVGEVLGREDAVRDPRERVPAEPLAALEDGAHGRLDRGSPVAVAHLEQAAFCHLQAGGLRGQVTKDHLGQTAVGGEDGADVFARLSFAVGVHERQLQALRVDVLRVGGPRARILAADLGPVTLGRGEPDQFGATGEDRPDQRHVGQVRSAAGVRVVRDDHVAGPQVLAAGDGLLDRVAERAEEAGDAVALGDQLAVGVGDADPEVEDLVDDRALRRALQRDEHLVADRGEALAQDVHGEPVGGAHWRASGTVLIGAPLTLPGSGCRLRPGERPGRAGPAWWRPVPRSRTVRRPTTRARRGPERESPAACRTGRGPPAGYWQAAARPASSGPSS